MTEPKNLYMTIPVPLARDFVNEQRYLEDSSGTARMRNRLRTSLEEMPPYAHALYFGCVGQSGHYLWTPGEHHPLRVRRDGMESLLGPVPHSRAAREAATPLVPWGWSLDGGLMPKNRVLAYGEAILDHRDGWTGLSFWDSTVDTRPGSVSVYVFDSVLDFNQAVRGAMKEFPTIWERYTFEVVPA